MSDRGAFVTDFIYDPATFAALAKALDVFDPKKPRRRHILAGFVKDTAPGGEIRQIVDALETIPPSDRRTFHVAVMAEDRPVILRVLANSEVEILEVPPSPERQRRIVRHQEFLASQYSGVRIETALERQSMVAAGIEEIKAHRALKPAPETTPEGDDSPAT